MQFSFEALTAVCGVGKVTIRNMVTVSMFEQNDERKAQPLKRKENQGCPATLIIEKIKKG